MAMVRRKLMQAFVDKTTKRLSATRIIASVFIGLILLGTVLLMLPVASRSGVSCGFRPALFTATSATCVNVHAGGE